ncbi:MAG: type II toxin-antitoxin system HicB family antitoxin [Lachnospiraceae bacterium]|nr:type II toxin-antitoxin system HicB family antitoxin [Lachnospiraceae bacterium]
MVKYDVFITWSEEDNAYIASVPEFAGCIADGQTREEALQNIEIVAQEWMEAAEAHGRAIPKRHNRSE